MSKQERADSAAHSAIELLEALIERDDKRAVEVVNSCDAGYTILALGEAWLNLAEYAEVSAREVVDHMRSRLPGGAR